MRIRSEQHVADFMGNDVGQDGGTGPILPHGCILNPVIENPDIQAFPSKGLRRTQNAVLALSKSGSDGDFQGNIAACQAGSILLASLRRGGAG